MKPDTTAAATAAPITDEVNYLSAEDILNSEDIDFVDVTVQEWKRNGQPGVIRLRAMTADEAIKFTEELKDKAKSVDSYIRIVAATAVKVNADGTCGEPLFRGDVAVHKLRQKKSGIFIRLQKAAMKLNNLIEEDDKVKNG
jgi:hypothetical protein